MVETLRDSYPNIDLVLKSKKLMVLDLRNVLLLGNQSAFDLCCNRKFTSSVKTALNALNTTSNGGGLRISLRNASHPDTSSGYGLARRLSPTASVSRI